MNEIERLIQKYGLVMKGDKLGTYRRVNETELKREIGPRKDEIIAYIKNKESEKKERVARRYATFESIPGVREIRAARSDNENWRKEFHHMMDTGSGFMRPGYIFHDEEEMSNLEGRFPQAVIALEIQYRASVTENYELSSIYNKAYNSICDGAEIDKVKAEMDEELKEYADKHFWD